MITGQDRGAVPFDGELGKELRRIWQHIRANQIIPTKGQKVSRTTNGTIVTNPPVAGEQEALNPVHSATYTGEAQIIEGPILSHCSIDGGTQATILLPPLHTSLLAKADKSTLLDIEGQWLPSGTYIGSHWEWPFDLRSSTDVGADRATRFLVVQTISQIKLGSFVIDWVALGTGHWRAVA